jgi:hypothetical protein
LDPEFGRYSDEQIEEIIGATGVVVPTSDKIPCRYFVRDGFVLEEVSRRKALKEYLSMAARSYLGDTQSAGTLTRRELREHLSAICTAARTLRRRLAVGESDPERWKVHFEIEAQLLIAIQQAIKIPGDWGVEPLGMLSRVGLTNEGRFTPWGALGFWRFGVAALETAAKHAAEQNTCSESPRSDPLADYLLMLANTFKTVFDRDIAIRSKSSQSVFTRFVEAAMGPLDMKVSQDTIRRALKPIWTGGKEVSRKS